MKPYITTNGKSFRVRKFPGLYLHKSKCKFCLNFLGFLNPYLNIDYTFHSLDQANDVLAIYYIMQEDKKYKRLP